MTAFGWLHFTDLHRGMVEQSKHWPDWEEKLFEDLAGLHPRSGPWDLLLFTGDLTNRGTAAEFQQVDQHLEKLWVLLEKLQPGHPVSLLAVPGNHDLERPSLDDEEYEAAITVLRSWHDHPEAQRRFWEKPDSKYRKVIDRAFGCYTKWWRNLSRGRSTSLHLDHGPLPGDFAATLEKDGARLGIVGLNSAFLQLDGRDYREKLVVDPQQFNLACGGDGPAWVKEHQACLLLTHHPPEWLETSARDALTGAILHKRFAVHLFGHMHETAIRNLSLGGSEPWRFWQGRSLFGLEEWADPAGRQKQERSYGYSAGRIELSGSKGELRLWPRTAQAPRAGGIWRFIPDHDFCELDESDSGTRPEEVKLLKPLPAPPKSASPVAPVAAPKPTATDSAHDPLRFRVLLLSTEGDLGKARGDVAGYLERSRGVEVQVGPGEGIEPAEFELVVLVQGFRWEGGAAVELWKRAAPEKREVVVSDEGSDWPPRRLAERSAEDRVLAFRDGLTDPHRFGSPDELPEKVGELVSKVLERRRPVSGGADFGLRPYEQAYLGFCLEAWKRGRTTAGRAYLVDSGAREEPYCPELYVALDGKASGWERGGDGYPRRANERNRQISMFGEETRRIPLARWVSSPSFTHLALIGAPGGGKTVFLTRIAAALAHACLGRPGILEHDLDLAAMRQPNGQLPIPLVIEATYLAKQDLTLGLEAVLQVVSEELTKSGRERPSTSDLRADLERGRYLLLVDALDEVADGTQRRHVLDLLRGMAALECFPRTQMVLTTRSAAYTGELDFGEFSCVEVAPLIRAQVDTFCLQWAQHRHRDTAFAEGLRSAISGLEEHVEARSGDQPLWSNPLMLTAICIVFEKFRTLPEDRARLCEILVDDLCRSRRSEDTASGWRLEDAEKKDLLQRIALAMQEAGAQTWPEAKALEEARKGIPKDETRPQQRAARSLQWVADHTGLIRFQSSGQGDEVLRFWHRLFREYLAASRLAQQDKVVREMVDDLWGSRRHADPFWEDIFRLLPRALGTREKALGFITRLQELAQDNLADEGRLLALAASGVIESRELFPSLDFALMAKSMADAYDRGGLAWSLRDRILFLEALGRIDPRGGDPRLHEERWVIIPGGRLMLGDEVGDLINARTGVKPREVDVAPFAMSWAPVTVQEYKTFLVAADSMNPAYWNHAPKSQRSTNAGWQLSFFSKASPNSAVYALSIYEVIAYCRWRTAQRTDGRRVRLPTEAEWEAAARGDAHGRYPWGNDDAAEALSKTATFLIRPVGVFPPSLTGLVDLVGSVAHLCDSLFRDPYGISATSTAASEGGVISPTWHLVRRGGAYEGESTVRCAFRHKIAASQIEFSSGFRCVLDPPP